MNIEIEKTDVRVFCDHEKEARFRNIEASNTGYIYVSTYNKSRPTDIYGVYKSSEGYRIKLTLENKRELSEIIYPARSVSHYTTSIDMQKAMTYLVKEGLLPKCSLYLTDRTTQYVTVPGSDVTECPAEFVYVYPFDKFEKVAATKSEISKLQSLEKRNNREALNNLVLRDRIIELIKSKVADCDIVAILNQKALGFSNKKSFNSLIKASIEYYLNEVVLKEIGCQIIVPKQKSTHSYKYDDILCYIGDIKSALTEGE